MEGIDTNRNFKNQKIYFNYFISGFDMAIPKDGDYVNNFSVEIEMNYNGRLKRVVIEMGFDYDEIMK